MSICFMTDFADVLQGSKIYSRLYIHTVLKSSMLLLFILSEVIDQLEKEGKVDTSSKNPDALLKLPLR